MIRLPDDEKEFLAVYTTEYDDSYIFEPIVKMISVLHGNTSLNLMREYLKNEVTSK